jgi:hypothetical protein
MMMMIMHGHARQLTLYVLQQASTVALGILNKASDLRLKHTLLCCPSIALSILAKATTVGCLSLLRLSSGCNLAQSRVVLGFCGVE